MEKFKKKGESRSRGTDYSQGYSEVGKTYVYIQIHTHTYIVSHAED